MRDALGVELFLIVEGDRFERENRFAGFVHRLDRVLETFRGSDRPELAVGVYEDWHAFGTGFARNASEIGGRLGSLRADADGGGLGRNTCIADVDIVIARSKVCTGGSAQCDVAAAGGVIVERIFTGGRVCAAGCVEHEGLKTVGRVVLAGGVAKERSNTVGRVVVAGGVAKERIKTAGRVVAAGGVAKERITTGGRVVVAGGVAKERINTGGRVVAAGGVVKGHLEKSIGWSPLRLAFLLIPLVLTCFALSDFVIR